MKWNNTNLLHACQTEWCILYVETFSCITPIFVYIVFILLPRENDQSAITSSLTSYWLTVYHSKMGKSREAPFQTAQQEHLPACSSHCSFNTECVKIFAEQKLYLWHIVIHLLRHRVLFLEYCIT